jgi:DNA-binding NarL/FixJ family response regulator
MPTTPISILIGDGDAAFRARIRHTLGDDGFVIVGEATDAASTVEKTLRSRPDVCLVDAALPGNALNAAAAIARRSPQTAIVVLADSADSSGLLAALQRGASGYLPKDVGPHELAKALRATLRGEPALPRAMLPALIKQVRRRLPQRLATPEGHPELSVRESDVADLLRSGCGTAEIAGELGLSPVTVRRHVSSVVRKLGAPDRQAAVRVLNRLQR